MNKKGKSETALVDHGSNLGPFDREASTMSSWWTKDAQKSLSILGYLYFVVLIKHFLIRNDILIIEIKSKIA